MWALGDKNQRLSESKKLIVKAQVTINREKADLKGPSSRCWLSDHKYFIELYKGLFI